MKHNRKWERRLKTIGVFLLLFSLAYIIPLTIAAPDDQSYPDIYINGALKEYVQQAPMLQKKILFMPEEQLVELLSRDGEIRIRHEENALFLSNQTQSVKIDFLNNTIHYGERSEHFNLQNPVVFPVNPILDYFGVNYSFEKKSNSFCIDFANVVPQKVSEAEKEAVPKFDKTNLYLKEGEKLSDKLKLEYPIEENRKVTWSKNGSPYYEILPLRDGVPPWTFSKGAYSVTAKIENGYDTLTQTADIVVRNLPEAQEKKIAYLTFDDGPSIYTKKIMDILESYGARGTFFMLGPNMERNPDLVKELVQRGHTPALHGYTHEYKKFYGGDSGPLNEMEQANDVLEKITGERSCIIRTPYGSAGTLTMPQYQKLFHAGYKIYDWNIDSQDSLKAGTTAAQVLSSIIPQINRHNTALILMHDKKLTVEYLPKVMQHLMNQGYEIRMIEELVPVSAFLKNLP